MYVNFKRNNENLEKVEKSLSSMDEQTAECVKQLIHDYKNATMENWSDKKEFESASIDNFINDFGFDEEYIANKLANNHPTLQQTFMRLCMKFIANMANKKYSDARNENSVQTAKKIIEATNGSVSFPMI